MLFSSTAIALALASLSAAGPLPVRSAVETLSVRATSPICQYADKTGTLDGVQSIMDITGYVDWFDIMLSSMWQSRIPPCIYPIMLKTKHSNIFTSGEKNWANNIYIAGTNNTGSSSVSGCSKLGGDCHVDNCADFTIPYAFWILKSLERLHSKVNSLNLFLLGETVMTGFQISQISADFSRPVPNDKLLSWVSAAFSLAVDHAPVSLF